MTTRFSAILTFVLWSGIFFFLGTDIFASDFLSLPQFQAKLQSYAHIKSFETSFVQKKKLKNIQLNLTSKGTLLVERPQRVNWKITVPAPVEVLIMDNKIEITSGEGADRQKQTLEKNQLGGGEAANNFAALAAWMKLDAEEIMKFYNVYEKNKNEFAFTAKSTSTAMFDSLNMRLDSKGHLQSLSIQEKSGDSIEIQFSAFHILKKN